MNGREISTKGVTQRSKNRATAGVQPDLLSMPSNSNQRSLRSSSGSMSSASR